MRQLARLTGQIDLRFTGSRHELNKPHVEGVMKPTLSEHRMILRDFHHPSLRLTCLACDIERHFDTAAIMARVNPETPLPRLLSDMAGELGCPAVQSGAECITLGAPKCHLYCPELAARPAVCGPPTPGLLQTVEV